MKSYSLIKMSASIQQGKWKHFIKIFLLPAVIIMQGYLTRSYSQGIAYIYTDSVMKTMPGYTDSIEKTETLQKTYQNQYLMLMYDLQKKAAEFQQRKDSMIPVIAQMKWKEIEKMKADADTFLQKANAELVSKRNNTANKYLVQLQSVLHSVSAAQKYTAVYDMAASKATGMLYCASATDITALIIAEIKKTNVHNTTKR